MGVVFGLKMGVIGFVFSEVEGVVHFHNPLLKLSLCSFWDAKKLGLFFIFSSLVAYLALRKLSSHAVVGEQ